MCVDGEEPTYDEVLALHGRAMLAAQQLEEAMIGLLGVRHELSVVMRRNLELSPDDLEELERLWEDLFTRTGGWLRSKLGLTEQLGEEVDRAVRARNLLAHHYLRDHAVKLERGSERSAMATRLRDAADRFRALAARLDVERMAAMHDADLTDDHVTTPGEARQLRYYDPALDDAVPPEPFED